MFQPALDLLDEESKPSIIDYAEVDVELDALDVEAVATQEPHFLDYDAVPPADFEESFEHSLKLSHHGQHHHNSHIGEQIKMEKKYERDGEVSDYELAASGYTKKEFTQDDNTLHLTALAASGNSGVDLNCKTGSSKSKHFLDENPIPPDYIIAQELREHHSLDRNFGRQAEQQKQHNAVAQSSASPISLNERHTSLYAKFSSELTASHIVSHRLPRGAAWTERLEDFDGHMQISAVSSKDMDITLDSKVECVYSLLSMLGSKDPLEMAKKFFELSENSETCTTLRRSGCIPLLVQMMHSSDNDDTVRKFACMALQNVVHRHPDEKAGRREAKVMRLLDQIMEYCHFLKTLLQSGGEAIADDSERHPLAAISSLMKVSFDEEHRHAMCDLGALQAIPNLVHLDHAVHGPRPEDQCCNSLRRYALMALTNLTFGDENNKALLCSQKLFMEALIAQLDAAPDDLLQVTASVLRNLSWRADKNMKIVLNEIGTVTALARAAMSNKNENTLKAILSALWNLSAHCSTNKAEFCAVDGALAFLVKMLTYEGPSKTLKIIENAGGILRNVSSHIAVCESYRQILREHNCLSILLQQLKSESLTVVSNSCGTLWNLSARCPEDQKFLWDNGAIPMLRSLIHSKHAMISEGSSAALKNLLNFRPAIQNQNRMDPIARSLGLKKLPTLNARKQKALQQELGEKTLSETSDILDEIHPSTSRDATNTSGNPLMTTENGDTGDQNSPNNNTRISRSATLAKSDSRDSIFSSKSDSEYENIRRSHKSAKNVERERVAAATTTAFEIENDVETIEEQPIDYSVKYNENSTLVEKEMNEGNDVESGAEGGNSNYPTYQETDLDQPTDFSLRYAENQAESDLDIHPRSIVTNKLVTENGKQKSDDGNEILLILEDSVKCYQTEDTPYIISNAASITDLRQGIKPDVVEATAIEMKQIAEDGGVITSQKKQHQTKMSSQYVGSYTPEKPINYCEEGTPGYFSRYDSFSSLDEAMPSADRHKIIDNASGSSGVQKKELKPELKETNDHHHHKPDIVTLQSTTNNNSALETPLMFSRRSSMDSLVNEDVGPCDDKSSVVSDFSRLASGIISPSEIPDSPTQSMPQTPRRNSVSTSSNQSVPATQQQRCNATGNSSSVRGNEVRRPLNSVFEDDLSTFNVENTPAQFSNATSLSNLSIIDEGGQNMMMNMTTKPVSSNNRNEASAAAVAALHRNTISEGEEEESNITNNDDILLASCINIGMNRTAEHSHMSRGGVGKRRSATTSNENHENAQILGDEAKQYCTEDTPALLSKVGSNSNLSLLSMEDGSSRNELKEANVLFDDISSNASDCGGAVGLSSDILQQCIRDGMKKKSPIKNTNCAAEHPIAMMRRGGNMLPPYLPVSDEMNKYLVEDSPCNFSVVSDLSNLTVGSSLVGPAVQLKENLGSGRNTAEMASGSRVMDALPKEDVRREHHQFPDDSLSSLSIDSEDDTNLLSQAIAAGCNRPKSNLGFNSASSINKKLHSISSSQPIPILAASSASSLTSAITARNYKKQQQQHQHHLQVKNRVFDGSNIGNNESYSSVDSSDSNDNQSKSLFELCILSGMYKTKDEAKQHKHNRLGIATSHSTQSNPNLKQFDSLPMPLTQQKSYTTSHHHRHHHHHNHNQEQHQQHHHHRERELKDEKLLLECINTGISKKIGAVGDSIDVGIDSLRISQNKTIPKNVEATSAAVLGQYHREAPTTFKNASNTAAPGVERNNSLPNNSNNISNSKHQYINNVVVTPLGDTTNVGKNYQPTSAIQKTNLQQITSHNANLQKTEISSSNNLKETAVNFIGSKTDEDEDTTSATSDGSNQSFLLETAPILKQTSTAKIADKQKDPDLMLKSVERLTLEFVTSAEQLRTQVHENITEQPTTQQVTDKRLCAILADENTNSSSYENSCPNDVSFPSISISAPILVSLSINADPPVNNEPASEMDCKNFNDFDLIDFPEPNVFLCNTQPNSLDTEADTLVNEHPSVESFNSSQSNPSSGINFELGGQVQTAAVGLTSNLLFNGTSGSIMTNSTMIAFEAKALSDNLKQLNDDSNTELTFSINSLDLDNVQPPSCMDSLNISSLCNDYHASTQPNSMQHSGAGRLQLPGKSPKFPRKTLQSNLLARRALGQLAGSAESVNSSFNLLDNIKPPSLMDELLDSMVSVASIQSEVADNAGVDADAEVEAEADNTSIASTFSMSNYETAAGVNTFDDNTVTLASCLENIPCDDADGDLDEEATFNDFNSAASTPKKTSPTSTGCVMSKRTLTPKQKRIMNKERYRTYTICSPLTLSEEHQKILNGDESLKIEIIREPTVPTSPLSECTLRITESVEISETASGESSKCNELIETADITVTQNLLNYVDSEDLDVHQNSETESCNGQQDLNEERDSNDNMKAEALKGRVAKPSICDGGAIKLENKTQTIDVTPGPVKGVRGRKKTPYISPYSQQLNSANKVQTRLATKGVASPARTATSTPPSRARRTLNIKTSKATPKSMQKTDAPHTTTPLNRQGTFIKDEPTNVTTQVPVVVTAATATITNTTSPNHRASKLPTKRALSTSSSATSSPKSTVSTVRKTQAMINTPSNMSAAAALRKTTTKVVPQRSNTNLRLSSATVSKPKLLAAQTKVISRTTPPSRSNSSLNANNSSDTTMANINQAKSRIANIWKRTGCGVETKAKQQTTSTTPTRPLTTSNAKQSQKNNVLTTKTLNGQTGTGGQRQGLIRSSTFDNTPNKSEKKTGNGKGNISNAVTTTPVTGNNTRK